MYTIQNNIEIIAGVKKYCLYDLNTCKLYSLDAEDVELINAVVKCNDNKCAALLSETVRFLFEEGIIVEEDKLVPQIELAEHKPRVNFAWIEITQNCNMICRHCYEGSSRAECKAEMSLDDFKVIIDKLLSIGVDQIQLIGGEPLTHSRFEEMIEYLAGKFSLIEVFTNGTLLNDRILTMLRDNGISLAVSIYSDNPKLHDYVTRTKGSFEKTYNIIKKAILSGISVRLSSVEMKDVPRFDISEFRVLHQIDLPRLSGRANLSLYSRDMLRRKLITQKSFEVPIVPEMYFKNKVVHNCFAERIYIDCEQNVYPCEMERRICYGNLRTVAIEEILDTELSKMTKDKICGCKDCEYRYACFDCRCDTDSSEIDSKPWYCTYNPEEGVWIDKEEFIDMLLKNNSVSMPIY